MQNQDLKTQLKNNLSGATKIAILGIGSELMADDVVGVSVAHRLSKLFNQPEDLAFVKVFVGETAPENLTGEIRKFAPSHLIMIDAADFGREPGFVTVFDPSDADGASFTTHRLPTKIIADYLIKTLGCKVFVIGIQPKEVGFGKNVSKEILAATDDLVDTISSALRST